MTGFFHIRSGRSMTKERTRAVLSRSGANSPWVRVARRASFASVASGAGVGIGGAEVVLMVLRLIEQASRLFLVVKEEGDGIGGGEGHRRAACATASSAERHRPQLLGDRPQHRRG